MIHSPKKSEKYFEQIQKEIEGFTDSSWANDACDSIHNEKYDLSVYFPNSDKDDFENEEWSFFVVDIDSGLKQKRTSLYSIESVIRFIKEYQKKEFKVSWSPPTYNAETREEGIEHFTFSNGYEQEEINEIHELDISDRATLNDIIIIRTK
tara:strand:+ start:307 stop:759 length:453 start_codon:yes stop_codon:yes gene_type:complete